MINIVEYPSELTLCRMRQLTSGWSEHRAVCHSVRTFVAKLAAYDGGLSHVPLVITYTPPLAHVIYLHIS
jgi:hypothetical protein